MQTFNKEGAKKTLTYTWYLYPMVILATSLLWVFGFNAFHQPTAHEKINLFIAAQVTSNKYEKEIKAKYEREKLREINTNSVHPTSELYYRKLQLYLSDSDIMILPKTTFEGFKNQYKTYFFAINDEMKQTYFNSSYEYYSEFEDGLSYGILFKGNNVETWLSSYMTFDETQDYYLVLNQASVNLGSVLEESNAGYDNALTFMNYLLEGNI